MSMASPQTISISERVRLAKNVANSDVSLKVGIQSLTRRTRVNGNNAAGGVIPHIGGGIPIGCCGVLKKHDRMEESSQKGWLRWV
jgi:hypothetical protein